MRLKADAPRAPPGRVQRPRAGAARVRAGDDANGRRRADPLVGDSNGALYHDEDCTESAGLLDGAAPGQSRRSSCKCVDLVQAIRSSLPESYEWDEREFALLDLAERQAADLDRLEADIAEHGVPVGERSPQHRVLGGSTGPRRPRADFGRGRHPDSR